MRSGGNNFNYFSENKLTKLANLVLFQRMLMFCLEDWGGEAAPPVPLVYSTAATISPWIDETEKRIPMLSFCS